MQSSLPAGAEDEPVLRIEPHELDFAIERGAGGAHDLFEHARIEEERRPEIEAEAIRFNAGGAAADDRQPLDDAHANARRREQDRRGQTTRPRAHDDDVALVRGALLESP